MRRATLIAGGATVSAAALALLFFARLGGGTPEGGAVRTDGGIRAAPVQEGSSEMQVDAGTREEVAALVEFHRGAPEPFVPGSVRAVLDACAGSSYRSRLGAAMRLGPELFPEEIEALCFFLGRKAGEDTLGTMELNAVKNEVLNSLVRQRVFPRDLHERLVAICCDPESDVVLRDYSVQFLGICYPHIEDGWGRRLVAHVLHDVASDGKSPCAGTALVAMESLAGTQGFPAARVARLAREMGADPEADPRVRVSALQVAARLNDPEVAALARELVSASDNVFVRMSALAVIGATGTVEDIALAERMARYPDTRLRTAAKAAAERLRSRLGL